MRNVLNIFVLLVVLTNGVYGMNSLAHLEKNKTAHETYISDCAFCVAKSMVGITNVISDDQLGQLISHNVDVRRACSSNDEFVYDVLIHVLKLFQEVKWRDCFIVHSHYKYNVYYKIYQDNKHNYKIDLCQNIKPGIYDTTNIKNTNNRLDYDIKNTAADTNVLHNIDDLYLHDITDLFT